jgi:hypothetical protein
VIRVDKNIFLYENVFHPTILDDDAFARVCGFILETMVAKSELSRNLKEEVATLVSKKKNVRKS